MYFNTKNILKNNHNHISKQILKDDKKLLVLGLYGPKDDKKFIFTWVTLP
jgi:hypothetical protein